MPPLPAPTTLPEVIARIRAVEASAGRTDGVVCFARLYRQVTETVNAELARTAFANPPFLERLDIVFANLFFTALEAQERDPARAPAAWAPLFSARAQHGIAPLQFAFAGMNAHINRDLPVALVATCEELGVELRAGSAEHTDFRLVNGLLARVEAQVKASYLTGPVAMIDRLLHRFHRLDDVIAMWDVRQARDAAWTNAEALWALRGEAGLRAEFVRALDRMVGFAGRGLVIPADTLLRRLVRTFRQ
ncbi:MAG: hypothetical protein QOG69_2318 [Actinomycetota bacterium]|nr:hypothetical protein [Actinomycetota bacterium]